LGLKVLHISKSDSGGAGIAAVRLHLAMVRAGIDSKILLLQSHNKRHTGVIKFQDSIIRKILRASRLPLNEYVKNARVLKSKTGTYDSFSFIRSDYRIHLHSAVKEADIINLHFVNGFVDYPTFFSAIKKPIFWTLHDKNPFQGGFHLLSDVENNIGNFRDLEAALRKEKLAIYNSCENLNIIVLNNKMLKLSGQSEHFAERPHYLIRNTLDIDTFKKSEKSVARKHLLLPLNKIILLYVSSYADNYNKGYHIFRTSVIKLGGAVLILKVGPVSQEKCEKIIEFGFVRDEYTMAMIYSAVDGVIISSREENLPNVLLESLVCGTPVISTPVDGSLDIIKNGFNGLLTNDFSSESLTDQIEYFSSCHESFDRDAIRAKALEIFSPEIIVKKYLDAYGRQ